MEHEFAEREHAVERAELLPSPDPLSSPLPSAIGNRAFTRLAQSATVDRRSDTVQGAGPLDPEIANEIQSRSGSGGPLDDATRTEMEHHLGTDLSAVRVHKDAAADSLSRSVQADAFTTGSDVFFRSGKYDSASSDGKRLLAHELTHTVQQTSGAVQHHGEVSHPSDSHELQAKAVGDAVASAGPGPTLGAGAPGVARQEVPEEEEEVPAVSPSLQRQGAGDEEMLEE